MKKSVNIFCYVYYFALHLKRKRNSNIRLLHFWCCFVLTFSLFKKLATATKNVVIAIVINLRLSLKLLIHNDLMEYPMFSGLLEELVELLEMKGNHLMEIKAAALKSLTAIIHLDRNPNFPKLST